MHVEGAEDVLRAGHAAPLHCDHRALPRDLQRPSTGGASTRILLVLVIELVEILCETPLPWPPEKLDVGRFFAARNVPRRTTGLTDWLADLRRLPIETGWKLEAQNVASLSEEFQNRT